MARLLLFRHAKSSRDDPALADSDRPLARRGERDAGKMGKLLKARGLVPDRILCSTALRTRQTLARAGHFWPSDVAIEFRDDLYDPGEADYLAVIAAHGAEAGSLMVVGHNPMIEDCLLNVANPGAEAVSKFPTAAIAVLDFDLERWSEIEPHSGRLALFLRPRDA